ncbi:MAG: threonylcarbamoyl-AMP synthase [Leptospira sp.]|nr:threonylcarbamoyl-AMP synthase [Leptospira sp.]
MVVFPTETVFGIGASSLNHNACREIYKVKNRPQDNPLIVHFANSKEIETYAILSNQARNLLERFAPGPLTLILKKKNDSLFSTGLGTIAVRIPSHKVARRFIEESKTPVSAPSANPSGKPSFTRNEDVVSYFDGKVDCILLEKATDLENRIGIESTVIDMSSDIPKLLRPGSIELEEIQEVLGTKVELPQNPGVISPGLKYRHYSPEGRLHIFQSTQDILNRLNTLGDNLKVDPKDNIAVNSRKIAILAYSNTELNSVEELTKSFDASSHSCVFKIQYAESNMDYAKKLYSFFLDCDKESVAEIFCESPRQGRLYSAISNRLKKAISRDDSDH